LYIHITNTAYSSSDVSGLSCLKQLLIKNTKKKVNILCAHKKLAHALVKDEGFKELLTNFSLTTGDNKNVLFNSTGNNIGTTFKTGINIEEPDNVFIIILPYFTQDVPDLAGYGIFTDGVPALIQSL